jgi:AhpD family alkylhydroperoxidase
MKELLSFAKVAPGAYAALRGVESYVRECGIETPLLELVRMRASQINRCAYCLDMHSKDARAAGESEQRLHALPAWREAPFYSERERAALAWTEAVTTLAQADVPAELYEATRRQFSEKEMADLSLAIIAINGWNRFCAPFRSPTPGSYQPPRK